MMELPVTFAMKPITWQRWVLVGAIPAVLILALFVRVLMVGSSEAWLFVLLVIAILGFYFYAARRQLIATRLTLEEAGFRYTRSDTDITVSWVDVRTVTPRIRGDKLVALAILTTQGKYLLLSGFDRMQEIADFIQSRVKSSEPDSVGAFRLNKNTGWLFITLFAAGIWMKIHYGEQSPVYDMGLLLQVGGLGGMFWLSPINLRVRQGNSVRRFFILLATWVAIVIVVVLVLNYFVAPKPH